MKEYQLTSFWEDLAASRKASVESDLAGVDLLLSSALCAIILGTMVRKNWNSDG